MKKPEEIKEKKQKPRPKAKPKPKKQKVADKKESSKK